MKQTIVGLLILAVALVAGCKEEMQGVGAAAPGSAPTTSQATTSTPPLSPPDLPAGIAGGKEEIVLTLLIPDRNASLPEVPGAGHGPACFTARVSAILGAAVVQPHGVIIGQVMPDGPAARAGIKSGDSIVKCDGSPVDCPRTFLPYLERTDKPREVKLTILRARPTAAPKPAAPAGEARGG